MSSQTFPYVMKLPQRPSGRVLLWVTQRKMVAAACLTQRSIPRSHGHCRDACADEERAAGLVEDADCARIADEIARA